MYHVPVPYPGELLYSVFARYAVHTGTVDARQVMEDLFGDRCLTASVDLNTHLETLLARVGGQWPADSQDIVYWHTLSPLYAPFIPEERVQAALDWMQRGRGGHIHTLVGRCAGKVHVPVFLRYCPTCLQEQVRRHGEFYWVRDWQAGGVAVCPRHGRLRDSTVRFQRNEKQRYSPATPRSCPGWARRDGTRQGVSANDVWLADRVAQLLACPRLPSPTHAQWTGFYRDMAVEAGLIRGRQVRMQDVASKVQSAWPGEWLDVRGLPVTGLGEPLWLAAMFRKHRKSFSYLQHFVVWRAFGRNDPVVDILRQVARSRGTGRSVAPVISGKAPTSELQIYRRRWTALLEQSGHRGVRHARFALKGGQSVYAWLYRHDRAWLLRTNGDHRFEGGTRKARVDWKARDYAICRLLIAIQREVEQHPEHPRRWSASWYLGQFPNKSSLEKHLDKLPLSACFLRKRAESVERHQKRRCLVAYRRLVEAGIEPAAWRVMRLAGLRPETIRPSIVRYVAELEDR